MTPHDIANTAAKLEVDFGAISNLNNGDSYKNQFGDEFTVIGVGKYEHANGKLYPKAIVVEDIHGNIYFHFNGTGDGFWDENTAAYGGKPSDIQDWALSYFDEIIKERYEGKSKGNLYVTGHSQGGNNAQFVTIRSEYGDYISNCVELDGPGFSSEFVEESKKKYGEAYYEMQRNKIWAYNGESDYVSCQGQEQIVPDGQVRYIKTPKKDENDNVMFVYHAADWMIDENGKLNDYGEESEFRKFVKEVVKEINDLPEEQRERTAKLAMLFAEEYLGPDIGADITEQDLEDFKRTLIPMIVKLMDKNPDMIIPVLIELGIEEPRASNIAKIIIDFNKLPPEAREKALEGLAQIITMENGEIKLDFGNVDIIAMLPFIWETALHDPENILTILDELGVDEKIKAWIAENPVAFVGLVLLCGVVIFLMAEVLINILAIIVIIDALIHIISGLKEVVESIIQALHYVKELLNEFKQWLKDIFNEGARYAEANPYFKADTDKLREYATRVDNVNRRLKYLDGDLRGLYSQVGLLDLWDILVANLITSGSPTLKQVTSYLNNTASRIETADNKANGHIGG